MRIGVVYPQTEYGNDPAAVRDYVQTAEDLGYTHILAYDHVLGANPDRPGGWQGPYTYESAFLEIFVLFSYMAAVTERIEFIPGILILPQRQTALVAKQAATLDVLSGGRLRLGVGIGWNKVEYQALGQDFHNRGRRVEEQIDLLRQLWTQPLVTFQGRWDAVPDAGLKPLPVQQPIPIWFGGHAEAVLKRIAILGDGWLPNSRAADQARPSWEKIQGYLADSGRPAEEVGLEARLMYAGGTPDLWAATMDEWRALGATHLSLNTMGAGLLTPQDHLNAIRRFAERSGFA
jgi:probable F420-dependent oxidoreductase